MKDAFITAGFCLAVYLLLRGAWDTCGDVAAFWRTCVRRRP